MFLTFLGYPSKLWIFQQTRLTKFSYWSSFHILGAIHLFAWLSLDGRWHCFGCDISCSLNSTYESLGCFDCGKCHKLCKWCTVALIFHCLSNFCRYLRYQNYEEEKTKKINELRKAKMILKALNINLKPGQK